MPANMHSMIKIAHRGNYAGKIAERENTVEYLEEAISAGYNVEVDAWLLNDQWFLGHDYPVARVERSFFERPEVWTHAKNLVGYVSLFSNPKVHTFWHNKDEFVFTSKNIKWCYEGVITHDGVIVMPDFHPGILSQLKDGLLDPLGVCSDDFSFTLDI